MAARTDVKNFNEYTREWVGEKMGKEALSLVESILGEDLPWEDGEAIVDLLGALKFRGRLEGNPVDDGEEEFTARDEGNTLASLCFRNCGPLENYHAEGTPIGDRCPGLYFQCLRAYNAWLCNGWER